MAANHGSSAAYAAAALLVGLFGGAAAAAPGTVYTYDGAGNLLRVSDTAIDPKNCGTVGTVCSTAQANTLPICVGGTCGARCTPNWADCNAQQSDGCETALTTPSNCGACGRVCSGNHVGTWTCPSGVCAGTCVAGWGDCNANLQLDGCETSLTTALNCGSCGNACGAGLICKNRACVDPCAGVKCKKGYVCDPELGVCTTPQLLAPPGQ